MAGDGGGGEVAVGPVAVYAAAEDVFFAAGVENGAVGAAAVGGGIDDGGVGGVGGIEFSELMGYEIKLN